MGNAELFYSALPPGSSRFRRRGKQHCPALQKRFPEIHLKVGGKEGAFALEDHSEQQLTLKGRLTEKMDLPLVPGYIIFISFPPGILKRIIGIAPDASIAEISPWRPEKGKFSLPETGSGLRFMRRAGIQPNPRLRKKTGGWLHNRTGNGGLREQISSGLYFFQAHPNIHWCIKSLFRKRAWAFFLPGIREMLIFPMFCLLFQVMRGCLRPCRFFTLHGERTAPASGHQAVFFKLFLPPPL